MAEPEIDLDPVDVITVGVEGEPGHRTFFLEAWQGHRSCTLVVEKAQVAELGTQLLAVLESEEELSRPAPEPVTGPTSAPGWRAGNIQISLDETGGRCVLLLDEIGTLDAEDEAAEVEELRSARLVATTAQIRGLAQRCLEVVSGGRPICPLCQLPMEPSGHVCPARNGHHPI